MEGKKNRERRAIGVGRRVRRIGVLPFVRGKNLSAHRCGMLHTYAVHVSAVVFCVVVAMSLFALQHGRQESAQSVDAGRK